MRKKPPPTRHRQARKKTSPPPRLQRLKPVRLFERAVEQIGNLIVDGDLQPGDKLPSESQLVSSLDVSRSSVREALRALESRGLIEVRTGAGAFVATNPFSLDSMNHAIQWLMRRQNALFHLLEVREVLEGLAAASAAECISKEALDELRDVVQMHEALSGSLSSIDEQVELDCRFHLIIAEASTNPIVQELIRRIVPAFCDSNRAVLCLSANMKKTLHEHQKIIDALAHRDPTGAERAVRSHITRVRGEIESIRPQTRAPGTDEPRPSN